MKPTVLHLCSNRWNSAITEYALRSAQSLAKAGWRSELCALPGSPGLRRAKELGVAGPSFRFGLGDIFALRRLARAVKADVVITYGGPETFLARFLGVPVVRFRGQDSDLAKPQSAFDLWLNVGFCRGILTPARVLKERFKAALGNKAVEAVTLGLDAEVFYARARKGYAMPRLMIVGRLDPIKGHEKFFGVFKELIGGWDYPVPAPYLEIIGQSSNISAADLRGLAKTAGLEEGVNWGLIAERVPNLPERMANATVGVIPSLGSEVICRVAEEFLLSGTPVLVADVGSLKEVLAEPLFGAVLQSGSEELGAMRKVIYEAFVESQADRTVRSRLAGEYFSLRKMGTDLEGFLLPLLKVRGS